MTENFDELDAHLEKKAELAEGEAIKMEHIMLEKVSMNPARRKLLRIVGVFGKDDKQLREESGLNDFFFKYNMDFLLKENLLKLEDGMYRLTASGIALHDSVC
jgi:hypothetical protein